MPWLFAWGEEAAETTAGSGRAVITVSHHAHTIISMGKWPSAQRGGRKIPTSGRPDSGIRLGGALLGPSPLQERRGEPGFAG